MTWGREYVSSSGTSTRQHMQHIMQHILQHRQHTEHSTQHKAHSSNIVRTSWSKPLNRFALAHAESGGGAGRVSTVARPNVAASRARAASGAGAGTPYSRDGAPPRGGSSRRRDFHSAAPPSL